MQRILFPIGERDYSCCQKRMVHLIKSIGSEFKIEVVTQSKEVYEDIESKTEKCANVSARLLEMKFLPLTFDYRDNLSKIFVQYTEDLYIPSTNLKMWKTAAFDDFWGHISGCTYPAMKSVDADMVMLPLLSYDDIPYEEMDVLYTSIAYMAKDMGKKVIGYQLFPVFNGFKLMPKIMDGIIVRHEYERQFYIEMGIPEEKLYLLNHQRDIYSLSTIEETYKNYMYNEDIEIKQSELGVVVLNHAKFRPQIKEIFQVLREAKVPLVLCLVKREFAIKDLVEDDIIKDMFLDDVEKIGCPFYLVKGQSLVPITMLADVLITPTFVTPLEFAVRYGKKAWVYNPYDAMRSDVDGVRFINKAKDLSESLQAAYKEKKKWVGINDILHRIIGK